MTIKYNIISKKEGDYTSIGNQYVCFGRIKQVMGEFKDKYGKDDFNGIYLDLAGNSEYSKFSKEDKLNHEALYQDLGFEEAFDGLVDYSYKDDVLQGIYYYADGLSFWHVVNAISVFRTMANHVSFFHLYNYLKEMGYSPLVIYSVMMNVNVSNGVSRTATLSHFKDAERYANSHIHLWERSEHMVVPSESCNVKSLIQLKKTISNTTKFPPMKEEWDKTGALNYIGRSASFIGTGARSLIKDNVKMVKRSGWDQERIFTISQFYEILDKLEESV